MTLGWNAAKISLAIDIRSKTECVFGAMVVEKFMEKLAVSVAAVVDITKELGIHNIRFHENRRIVKYIDKTTRRRQ